MTLRLDKLPDRQAVKFTFTASPDLKAALNDYAKIYRRAYGQKKSEGAPDFRVYTGRAGLGAAWKARSNGKEPRDYLSVQLDDASFPEPIRAALFEEDGAAFLVWNRRER